MNAAKVGPRKTQTALTKITLPFGTRNGKRPTPFAEVHQEFIANSSLVARVTVLVNKAGLVSLALMERRYF
jgi:hypothetical protein